MKSKTTFANLALLLAAFIWGTAFVAQSVGMDHVGPFTFLFVRSFIGAAALLVGIFVRDQFKKSRGEYTKSTDRETRLLAAGGTLCGITLCIASGFQQVGMQYTSVGNAGFITSMYMLIVPIFSLFFGKKVPGKIWLCVVVATIGMYFLSVSEGLQVSKGDIYIAVCAIFFAVQIMIVDYYAPKVDGVKLSCFQFVITGMVSMVLAFALEEPDWGNITKAAAPLLYAGVLSSGVAYTLQIIGQKYAQPTIATLFMSMESVFSLLGGIVVLRQIPNGREIFGCVLVLAGVLMSQISIKALKGALSSRKVNA